jgi:hypothetical protein
MSLSVGEGKFTKMSVPEILTSLIPEILARLRTTKRVRKLPRLRLCRERREEDVGNAKTTRSVEILLKAGHAKTEVARLSGVSLRSVQRIAEESPVGQVDDAKERAKRQIGRPSLARSRISGNRWSRSCRKRRI